MTISHGKSPVCERMKNQSPTSVEETRLSVGLERVVELSEFVESLIGLGGWKKSVIWGWGFAGRVLASCAHVKSGLSLCH